MIKLTNLTKVFNADNINMKVALREINLNINEGDFVTIIGANGSGKSTLFNLISGNHLPSNGEIIIDNVNVTNDKINKRVKKIGLVFQDPLKGTASDMSVLENLKLALMRNRTKRLKWAFNKNDELVFKELLKTLNLGLEDSLNQKVGLLSGGQRQAITLLMATLANPKLLLLDEHTAALDPKTAKTVLNITNEIVRKNNLTTIMITHNMKDALDYGNRLIMLKEGKIVLDVSGNDKDELSIESLVKLFYN